MVDDLHSAGYYLLLELGMGLKYGREWEMICFRLAMIYYQSLEWV